MKRQSIFLLVLVLAGFWLAQAPPAQRVSAQTLKDAREKLEAEAGRLEKPKGGVPRLTVSFKNALADWLDLRLPQNRAALDRDFLGLEWDLNDELDQSVKYEDLGFVHLRLTRSDETPDWVLVTVNWSDLSLYRFDPDSHQRVLNNQQGEMQISDPDEHGDRLVLVRSQPEQELSYKVFHVPFLAAAKDKPILSGSVLVDNAEPFSPNLKVSPHELLIEYKEPGKNATQVRRYKVDGDTARRIDPTEYVAPALPSNVRLNRLAEEARSLRARELPDSPDEAEVATKSFRDQLRDWIDEQMPATLTEFEKSADRLQWDMRQRADRAGILGNAGGPEAGGHEFGWISRLEIQRAPNPQSDVAVIVGESVPCGENDSVYVYHFTARGRQMILADYHVASWSTMWGSHVAEVRFSWRNDHGDPLLAITRFPVQCGSSWTVLHTSLYRVEGASASAVLSSEHDNHGYDYDMHVTPSELILEMDAYGLEPGFSRRRVYRYDIGRGAKRVEPFAFSAKDFTQEWSDLPWEEAAPVSEKEWSPRLAEWHNSRLKTKTFYVEEASEPVVCSPKAPSGRYVQVAWSMEHLDSKPDDPPAPTYYFLIQERGPHLFTMVNIAAAPFPGCPAVQ